MRYYKMYGFVASYLDAERILRVIAILPLKMLKHNCPVSFSRMPACVHQHQNFVMAWQSPPTVVSPSMNVTVKCNCMLKMLTHLVMALYFFVWSNSKHV